jgi:hypothetical protein
MILVGEAAMKIENFWALKWPFGPKKVKKKLMDINSYYSVLKIDSKQTEVLRKIQTCLWILKISTANQMYKTFVKCLCLPKRK